MADQDQGPSLELPSLGFRRRKKSKPEAAEPESTPDTATAPVADEPTAVIEAPEPVAEPVSEPAAEPAAETPTEVIAPVVDEPPAAPAKPAKPVKAPKAAKAPKPPKERKPPKTRARWLGAALIGLLAGFAIVFMIGVTLQACDAARGTTSCGGPGLFVLLAILVLITIGTARLLKVWGFTDSGTVAFLGIALTGIVVLVFLTAQLQSVGMVLVIPVITMLAFLVADWVASAMSEANDS